MSNPGDLSVAKLARGQHGLWTRQQALAAGLSRSMIRARLDSGLWVKLDTGVYGAASARATWQRSVMAAVLAEPWAVASHRSAAVLHGLDGFRPGRPQITIRPGANARGRLAIAHRGIDVQTTRIDDIPVTSLAQTFVDLSQVSNQARLQRALSARAETSSTVLEAVRERYCELAPRGGRNLRKLRDVLDGFGAGDLPTRSELERVMQRVLSVGGIPAIEWEAPFPGRQPSEQRVDGLIPVWSMVIEGDGRAWHTRIADFERDRRRDAEAAAAGFLTLRFTWFQLTTSPDWVRDVTRASGAHRIAA
jgi:hypothetical protein